MKYWLFRDVFMITTIFATVSTFIKLKLSIKNVNILYSIHFTKIYKLQVNSLSETLHFDYC